MSASHSDSDSDSDNDNGVSLRETMGFVSFGTAKPAPKSAATNSSSSSPVKVSTGANSAPVAKRQRLTSSLNPTSSSFTPSYLSTTNLIPASLPPKSVTASFIPRELSTTGGKQNPPYSSTSINMPYTSGDAGQGTYNAGGNFKPQFSATTITAAARYNNFSANATSSRAAFDVINPAMVTNQYDSLPQGNDGYATYNAYAATTTTQSNLHLYPQYVARKVQAGDREAVDPGTGTGNLTTRALRRSDYDSEYAQGYTNPTSGIYLSPHELAELKAGRVHPTTGVVTYFQPCFIDDDPWAELKATRKKRDTEKAAAGKVEEAETKEVGEQAIYGRFKFGGHDIRKEEDPTFGRIVSISGRGKEKASSAAASAAGLGAAAAAEDDAAATPTAATPAVATPPVAAPTAATVNSATAPGSDPVTTIAEVDAPAEAEAETGNEAKGFD